MKSIIMLFITLVLMISVTTNAQDQSTRFEKQHHSRFVKSHLKETEEMLLKSFESTVPGIVSSSLQTLRELEQIFPEHGFSSLIDPLIKIAQDEKKDTQDRILSALALDGLHSDKGDASIFNTAKATSNKSVKDVCIALSIESLKTDVVNKTAH